MPRKPAVKTDQPITIHQVARHAGVSIGTVSKALHGTGQLKEETRRKVRAAIEELGYRPNEIAQSLARKRSFTVGLITTDSYGRFTIPIVEGIDTALATVEFNILLCNTQGSRERERQQVLSLQAKQVDGIIVTSNRTDPRPALNLRGIPTVYAYTQVDDVDALCLLPDDRQGGRLVGEHLLQLGHSRLGFYGGPEDYLASRERLLGFEEALFRAGVKVQDQVYGNWTEEFGHQVASRVVDLGLTGVFCASDQIARGVLDRLRELGKRVPEDVSVVGFDNWATLAPTSRPGLTSVDMNLHELGHQAALLLLDLIDGAHLSGTRQLPCQLVVRKSTGKASTTTRRSR